APVVHRVRRRKPSRRTRKPPEAGLRRPRQRTSLSQVPPLPDHTRSLNGADPVEDQTFDRIPPQDLNAEQCVLGGMLLSKRAIAEVIEIVDAEDFYRPQHETIFRAAVDMYGRNEPADQITIGNYLRELGILGKVGGPLYLSECVASVPTAANAGYYAEIVRDCAIRRRIVEAG